MDEETPDQERLVAALAASGYRTQVATTAREALQLAEEVQPAVVISEVVLPERSGYELARSLREKWGEALPILLVSSVRTEPLDAVVAFLIGADDYITKPFEMEELLARVHRAVARAAASAPETARRGARGLTAREFDVLRLLSAGLSQKKIAERLAISPRTVATHIQRILGKLGVHSRAEAVAVAYRSGLLNRTAKASDDTSVDGAESTTGER